MKTGLTVASERAAIEKLALNAIRTPCLDAVQAANSRHPGSPMGMAPPSYVLWQRFLRAAAREQLGRGKSS
jgi:transketolase